MAPISPTRIPRFELSKRLRKIKLLCLDVDGVLTDGGLYYADDGLQFRKFNVKDGQGIKRALEAGVEVAIISAGPQASIRHRAQDLGLRHVFTGVEDKLEAVLGLCRDLEIDISEAAHMGDDLNDLPVMEAVGCPLTVPDALPEVRDHAVYVTANVGGAGAVREICDLLVTARAE